jgi:DNA-binding FadR family transcriptional regulator
MISPVKRVSTAEAVANHLVDRIQAGDFGPGDTFPSERDLQDQLGVGRLSVREGLARLSALGIIQVDHGKGARVRAGVDVLALGQVFLPLFPNLQAKAFHDLLRARSVLDSELAAQAALTRTEEDLRGLADLLDHPGEALSDDRALAELDFAFHREVARIGDNAYLAVVHEALADPIREYLLCYVRVHPNRQEVIDRHRPILDTIAAQDPEAARKAAVDHLETCKASIDCFLLGSCGK